jgi:hypothetical protein
MSQIRSARHVYASLPTDLARNYPILCLPPGSADEHTQAYFVVKSAQEKEELQRKGDALDDEIRKAEKEIRALEKTLTMMEGKNQVWHLGYCVVARPLCCLYYYAYYCCSSTY